MLQARAVAQPLALAPRLAGEVGLQRAVVRQAGEVLLRRVRQRDAAAAGQRMAAVHHEVQRVGHERQDCQSLQVGGARGDADVAQAVAHAIGHAVAGALLRVHRDAGMRRQEGGQRRGQVFAHGGGVAEQAHVAGQAAAVRAEFAAQLLHLLQHDARMVRQRLPGRGGAHSAPAPDQQRRAERLLHREQALAGRRQRQVRPLRARRDRAGLVHVEEEPQVRQVEAHAAR